MKKKRKVGRKATRKKKDDSILYYLFSEVIFSRIVRGDKDYLFVGDGAIWWKENKEKMVKGQALTVRIRGKAHLAFTAVIEKWEIIDEPEDDITGLVGNYIKIYLKDVSAEGYARTYSKVFTEEKVEEIKRNREEVVLKSKIRKAFK